MATSKWVYALASGTFLRGGFYEPAFDGATEAVVEFPDADPNPDLRLHRFDAVAGKRLATPAELAAYDATVKDAASAQAIDTEVAIKAAVITGLIGRLGRQPTGAEIAAERARFMNVYKTLVA